MAADRFSNPAKPGPTSSLKVSVFRLTLVVDAPTTLAAVLPDADSTYARAAVAVASGGTFVVPALWAYEVQNGLVMAIRRKRLDASRLDGILDVLRSLAPTIEAPQGLGRELQLARTHGLSAYDAAYLAAARNNGATLATNDRRLRDACASIGIAVFRAP